MAGRSITIQLGKGTSRGGLGQFQALMDDISSGLSDTKPLTAELDRTSKTIMAGLRSAVPDGDLSGDGRGPLGIKAYPGKKTIRGGFSAGIQATGPWQFVEYPTKAHQIRRRRARALAMSDGGYATSVRHPGTRGKGIWRKGVAGADKRVQGAGNTIIQNAINLTANAMHAGKSMLGSSFSKGLL